MQNVDIMCFNGGFIVVVDGPGKTNYEVRIKVGRAEFYQNEMGELFCRNS